MLAVDVEVGLGVRGDAGARPRRAGRCSALAGDQRGEAPRRLHRRHGTAGATVAGYVRRHVPRRPAATDARQARRHHGRDRRGRHLRRARRRRQPALPAASGPPGLRPGDHVAFCLENHPRFFEIWGAPLRRPLLHGLLSRLTPAELAYIVDDCGARVFVTSRYKADQAAEILAETPGVELRLMLDGTIDGYESLRGRRRRASRPSRCRTGVEGDRHALLVGHHRPAQGRQGAAARRAARQRRPALVRARDRCCSASTPTPCTSPPRRCTTPRRCASAWPSSALGGTVVVMEHFDPEEALALIERHQVTHASVVPTMFVRMLKLPDEVRARYDLSSLQVAVHAAAPCPVAVKRQMIDWWGPCIHEYYAGTEGNGFVYCNSRGVARPPGHRRQRARSAPSTSSTRTASELPPGESGHDLLRGRRRVRVPQRPREDGRRRATERGWTTLGDVGYLDERRLPLPHRPQGVHDHLRRREHLPAGGRERAHRCTPR